MQLLTYTICILVYAIKGLGNFIMSANTRPAGRGGPADLDNYDIDLDDIFGDLTPPPEQDGEGNKRKAPENAGVDEEAPVAKRARAPHVKLDEQR